MSSMLYVCSVVSDSLRPQGLQPDRLLPLSMGFFRQEYLSRLLFPSPGDLPNPGIKPVSLEPSAPAGKFITTWATWEVQGACLHNLYFEKSTV